MQTVTKKNALKALTLAILTLAAAVSWTGCATGGGDGSGGIGGIEFNCDTARKAYATYLATMLVRDVSQQEIEDAKRAAVFLEIWCGWTEPVKTKGRKSPVDRNGVPVLIEPK